MTQANIVSSLNQTMRMERYYRFHSKIYDATRWSYLFGRKALAQKIADGGAPARILEIGCGTGVNLVNLGQHFPQADLVGVDTSAAMLNAARRKLGPLAGRVELRHAAYTQPLAPSHPFDLVVFSYALSMFNPGWEQAIISARTDLAPGGRIAVVDFHDTPLALFKRWMGVNHTRLAGHLLPYLRACFQVDTVEVHQAYGGVWSYFMFMGKK